MQRKGYIRFRESSGDRLFTFFSTCFMFIVCLVIAYPLYHVVMTAISDPQTVQMGRLILYPRALSFDGFRAALSYKQLWTGLFNSIRYTFFGTLIALVCTIPAGYALAQKRLSGRRQLMLLFVFTMFFNGGMVPLYITVYQLGLLNTMFAFILPSAVSSYNLIVCCSFYTHQMSEEILDAAKIDGCTEFGCFFRIALPLSLAIVAVMAFFYANSYWNQYFNAVLYMRDDNKMPLQYFLNHLLRGRNPQMESVAVIISCFPLLATYPFLQKYFAKGVTIGAIKG